MLHTPRAGGTGKCRLARPTRTPSPPLTVQGGELAGQCPSPGCRELPGAQPGSSRPARPVGREEADCVGWCRLSHRDGRRVGGPALRAHGGPGRSAAEWSGGVPAPPAPSASARTRLVTARACRRTGAALRRGPFHILLGGGRRQSRPASCARRGAAARGGRSSAVLVRWAGCDGCQHWPVGAARARPCCCRRPIGTARKAAPVPVTEAVAVPEGMNDEGTWVRSFAPRPPSLPASAPLAG